MQVQHWGCAQDKDTLYSIARSQAATQRLSRVAKQYQAYALLILEPSTVTLLLAMTLVTDLGAAVFVSAGAQRNTQNSHHFQVQQSDLYVVLACLCSVSLNKEDSRRQQHNK